MKKGAGAFNLLITVIITGVLLNGVIFGFFSNRSNVVRRALMETNIIDAINKMELKKVTMRAVISSILFLSTLLIACQGIQRVEAKDRTSLLQGSPHAGTWESIDVFLKYQYVNQPGIIKLNIQGKAKRLYDQLEIWLFFCEAEGKILETKSVYNSGYLTRPLTERQRKVSIEKTFEMPLETNYLAFQSRLGPVKTHDHELKF